MKTLLKKNQAVSILPEDVQGATTGKVIKSLKDYLEIEISEPEISCYKEGCSVELFSPAQEGMLYFESVVENIQDNILKIKSSDNYEILQRREYTRIPLDRNIKLKDEDINCHCIDISAGGMKIETEKKLDTEKDYTISFTLEGSATINCYLRPIRITKNKENGKYIVSGRFVLLKNIDKIAVVQYCFKKEAENKNK